jgi:hypothetical protein
VATFTRSGEEQTILKKCLFVVIILLQFVFGFLIVPNLYQGFFGINVTLVFYYIYPIFSLFFRLLVNLMFYHIRYNSITWNQLPFFFSGIDFGIVLTLTTDKIEFWFFLVYVTLMVIESRRYIVLRAVIKGMQMLF